MFDLVKHTCFNLTLKRFFVQEGISIRPEGLNYDGDSVVQVFRPDRLLPVDNLALIMLLNYIILE